MTPLWTTSLPASLTGSMQPVFDPTTDSVYISDGWGTAFSSLSLRRLSVLDGSVTGSVRLRAPVFSVALGRGGEGTLVASGKRLIELRRSDLEETARWEDGVPRNSHYSARVGRRALLMGWAGPSLGVFDLNTGACTRRKVGSCQGLVGRTDGTVLVCSGKQGVVSSCDPESGVVTELARPGPFIHAAFSDAAALLALGLGDPFVITDELVTYSHTAHRIAILQLNKTVGTITLEAPEPFDSLWLSEDGSRLFLGQGARLQICTFDGSRLAIAAEHRLPEPSEPFLPIPERGIFLGADLKSDRGTVAAWRI